MEVGITRGLWQGAYPSLYELSKRITLLLLFVCLFVSFVFVIVFVVFHLCLVCIVLPLH